MKTGLLLIMCLPLLSHGQNDGTDTIIPKKKYFTQRLTGEIHLDGKPDEQVWNLVEWSGDFTQYMPKEGQAPSQPSRFKILYDDKFLYIAAQCFDSSPDSIIRRMSRRDEFPGDWIEINIDSYHDLRTAFSFTLSVSGVRGDEFVSNNGDNWDVSWNPIWYAKTHIDGSGWTGEIKIPFSQLRYGKEEKKVWGLQVTRRIFRQEERSSWQYIPQRAGVWVSAFGELHGLNNIPVHRQVEIAPYLILQADKYKKEAGNPFADGFDGKIAGGVDGKFAVTNDLILDFTINPDFGQVEADPSQVRIDGFQNFFQERRPFFVESRNIFDYPLTGSIAGGDYDSDLLFYSRRIGSSPHGFPQTSNGEHVKLPFNTTILGAAKFSGKTRKGLSVGILETVTEREMATIDHGGQRRKEMVEPLTNYFVTRLQQDYNEGNTIIGGIITAVNREKGMDDMLHRNAYSGGLDFMRSWKNRTWYIRSNLVFSHVDGSREAILRTQTSFEHLFQRPNASEFNLDSSRTSLSGLGGTIRFGKSGGRAGKLGQVFRFETGVTFRSPGLELNDIGFMYSANEINHFTWMGLRFQRQFSIFRSLALNYNHWSRWDFGGQFLYQAFNFNSHAVFKNNWMFGTGVTWNPYEVLNHALRGASSLRRPPGIGHSFYIISDSRRKIFAEVNGFNAWAAGNTVISNTIGLDLVVQPADAFKFSLGGEYSYYTRKQDQFVANITFNNETRTIVGRVKQNTLRFTGRMTYNITPDLTVQFYGQPFITRPLYERFGLVTDPMSKSYDQRFTVFSPQQIFDNNNLYSIDEDRDGIIDYEFSKPDFNFVQFRSNLVVRWEYKPGSELYLVWSQSNTPAEANADFGTPVFSSLFDNAFAEEGRNIFLVKWTYRILR